MDICGCFICFSCHHYIYCPKVIMSCRKAIFILSEVVSMFKEMSIGQLGHCLYVVLVLAEDQCPTIFVTKICIDDCSKNILSHDICYVLLIIKYRSSCGCTRMAYTLQQLFPFKIGKSVTLMVLGNNFSLLLLCITA